MPNVYFVRQSRTRSEHKSENVVIIYFEHQLRYLPMPHRNIRACLQMQWRRQGDVGGIDTPWPGTAHKKK